MKLLSPSHPPSRTAKSALRRSAERGLTLVEIVIVLVILSVVMSFLLGRLFKAGAQAKADLSRTKMLSFKEQIYMYQMRNNQLPPDLASAGVDDATDAWGAPIQYRTQDSRTYAMKSLGADGKDGGTGPDEDIVITGP